MWFFYCLTWFSFCIQSFFIIICMIAGLYYLAELVEEYTVLAKKIISRMTMGVLFVFVGLLLFEDFPFFMIMCGVVGQITHLLILKTFPYISMTSPTFLVSLVFLFVNHYLAFRFLSDMVYSFSEIIAYFIVCLWLIPLLLLISLSANDSVLPVVVNQSNYTSIDDLDVVGKYILRKGKSYGLLTLFNYCKESLLPERTKKRF